MRQVFTSPRLENVEHVAKMLEGEGIEVRITNGRSYKGGLRANFSYRDGSNGPQPALWIIKSEDQPRARSMLREMGLMDSSRNAPDSFLAVSFRGENPYAATPAQKRSFRMKVGLLIGIGVVLGLALMHGSKLEKRSASDAATSVAANPASKRAITAVTVPAVIADSREDTAPVTADPVAPTPRALAEVVFASALHANDGSTVCLALDGKDAPEALIVRLKRSGRSLTVASQCALPTRPGDPSRDRASGREASFLEVGAFRPDPAEHGAAGTIQRSVYGQGGEPAHDALEVRRSSNGWSIIEPTH